MNNRKDNDLSKYIVNGVIIGVLVGGFFSIVMRNNIFFAISGTGFGLSFGILISIIIWVLKEYKNQNMNLKNEK